ncbi:Hsp70 family protein [Frankia sp. CNm7]|uniref:Hsp70 family protein n=1 Tax=Frankia nepalensis TaxID=1836974 RepID=A0A937RPB7_9ACTN|nr:Hsp70 family protein [Frankia nepalensis]MBL7497505.1 Hsp70 family protein [Frankia nepalensis]MBL7510228.1 Hsp70 family protein [Frankia nepalensis]MBL7518656.1 Hsp70 family protein [Frankia nepalensis]MBL7630939.1 Hsp70 family protein [Frankia nepalensis]
MSGRLGIDFGTSNSVVATWDERAGQARTVAMPELGVDRRLDGPDRLGGQGGAEVMHVVPSLLHVAGPRTTWYGGQVVRRGLYEHPLTFRWMKRYVSQRAAPVGRRLPDGRRMTPVEAAEDFLVRLVQDAAVEAGGGLDEEVAFSVPVESFEHYDAWLRGVAETAGVRRFRLIDEASAAALGYGARIQPGDVYLVFDFGGGTLDVSVVRIEEESASPIGGAGGGRRCRVLGKRGADVGGASIDGWLFAEVLRRGRRSSSDEDVRRMSAELLVRCEAAKEALSTARSAEISAQDPETGRVLDAEVTRDELEELLDAQGLYTDVERVIGSALGKARDKGFDEDSVKQVLLVGGSSLIPSVRTQVRRRFGRDRVAMSRPLDVVAAGAAAFVAGVDFYDHIQHDYAVRHVNATTGAYEYRTVVEAGTSYPTRDTVTTLTVKATFDGQHELGLAIFELSEPAARSGGDAPVELMFDGAGAARLVPADAHEQRERTHFWMNADAPTFLVADPPGRRGEDRFTVEFHVDDGKRLLVTARDLRTGRLVHHRTPVVRLT